jgi:hypothetical protein
MHGRKTFVRVIGRSVEGRDQRVHANFDLAEISPQPTSTLLIGGMHGDEVATILLLEDFVRDHLAAVAEPVVVLPLCNPDAHERLSRYNARGVDINRNCGFNWRADSIEPPGAHPWSEPETRALRDFILAVQPSKIVSLHWALAEIDADGHQSTGLAQAMWDAMSEEEQRPYRLRITEIGRGQRRLERVYTTCPGSLGQWCGYALEYESGRGAAMITLELPYEADLVARPDELPLDHLQSLHDLWARDPRRYLRAVEPAVHKMLIAACRFDRRNDAI